MGEYGEPGMKLAFGMKLKGKKEMQKKMDELQAKVDRIQAENKQMQAENEASTKETQRKLDAIFDCVSKNRG